MRARMGQLRERRRLGPIPLLLFGLLLQGPGKAAAVAATDDGRAAALGVAWEQRRHLRIGPGFFNDLEIYQGDLPIGLDSFAGNAAALFPDSPQSQRFLRDYRRDKIVGVALYGSGIAIWLATQIFFGVVVRQPVFASRQTARWVYGSSSGLGLLTMLVGAYWTQSSKAPFAVAVEAYNRDLLAAAHAAP